jgi:hypothetical protein
MQSDDLGPLVLLIMAAHGVAHHRMELCQAIGSGTYGCSKVRALYQHSRASSTTRMVSLIKFPPLMLSTSIHQNRPGVHNGRPLGFIHQSKHILATENRGVIVERVVFAPSLYNACTPVLPEKRRSRHCLADSLTEVAARLTMFFRRVCEDSALLGVYCDTLAVACPQLGESCLTLLSYTLNEHDRGGGRI